MRAFVADYERGFRPAPGSGRNPNNQQDPGWESAWTSHLPADRAALEAEFRCEDETQRTWTDAPGGHERRPANCVTFYVAYAFCIWDGGRLPTDAELNFAAAGGDEQRLYPWSVPPQNPYITGSYASYFFIAAGPLACYGDGVYGCTVDDLVFVGTKPDGNGRWEHADLAGNVHEYVQDLYAPYPSDCDDCANLTEGTAGVVRGGGFANNASLIQSDARLLWNRNERSVAIGVRCARAP
jgi:formylglycine-generating enzyme required for sulfatase activity